MDRDQASFELLAHFDRPKTINCPDFEWVDEVESVESPSNVGYVVIPPTASESPIESPGNAKRGIRWVLQWAAALAMLAVAAGVLIESAYLMEGEHKLVLAARAGAMEATLPRATYESVTSAIERRLSANPALAQQLHLSLVQNGSLVQRHFRQNDGDRFAIALWAPSNTVVPGWLRTFMFWRSNSRIQAHAEQQVPGRKLSLRASIHTAAE